MSLADQVGDLEDDLREAQAQAKELYDNLSETRDYINDLKSDLKEATAFIDYVDATSPELRVAYGAATKLK